MWKHALNFNSQLCPTFLNHTVVQLSLVSKYRNTDAADVSTHSHSLFLLPTAIDRQYRIILHYILLVKWLHIKRRRFSLEKGLDFEKAVGV